MRVFFTSDTHFGHTNILTYCSEWRRSWAETIEEHDEKLIHAWNLVVRHDDLVYHLGDFSLVKDPSVYLKRLGGIKVLVKGNHDKSKKKMMEAGFAVAIERADFVYAGRRIICMHNPAKFAASDRASADILMHGHLHGNDHRGLLGDYDGNNYKLMDVGIDARRELAPASLDALIAARMFTDHVVETTDAQEPRVTDFEEK